MEGLPAKMIVNETSRATGRKVELKDRPDLKSTPSLVSSSRTPSPSIFESDVLEEKDRTCEETADHSSISAIWPASVLKHM